MQNISTSFITEIYRLITAKDGEVSFYSRKMFLPDVDWISEGLSSNKKHGCWSCAQKIVIFGVIIPFLWDIEQYFPNVDKVRTVISKDGIKFWIEAGYPPLLSINRFAIYCHDGKSTDLHARLDISMYTNDKIPTNHLFNAQIPEPRTRDRIFNRKVVLSAEVSQLLNNTEYPALTRLILGLLMKNLCVGRDSVLNNSQCNLDKIQGN